MYDGKKNTSEKIIYDALDNIKDNNKNDPYKLILSRKSAAKIVRIK